MIKRLITHRLKIWWAYLFRGRKGMKMQAVLSLLGLAFFVVISHFGTFAYFSALEKAHPGTPALYLPAIFGVISAFGLVPIMALTLSELYINSDVDLLMASPLSLGQLFVSKFTGLVTASAGLSGVLLLSTLSGYGRAVDVPGSFYLAALALVLLVTILLVSLDMILVMLAARIMPAKRIQGLVIVMSALVGVVLWLAIQVFSRNSEPASINIPSPSEPNLLPDSPPPQLQGLITSYPARALQAIESSDFAAFVVQTALFIGSCALIVVLCFLVFKLTFYEGSQRVRSSASPRIPSGRKQRLRERAARKLPSSIRGLVIKDWLSFPRDLRYLANLIFPFAIVFYFAIAGFSPSGGPPALWPSVAPVMFLNLMIAAGVVMPSIGMEGRNIGLLRSLPTTTEQVIIAKFATFYPLVLAGTWLALIPIALYRGATAGQLVGMLAGTAWMSIVSTALAVGFGALGARFDAQSPNKAIGPAINMLSLLVGVLSQAANTGLMFFLIERPRMGGAFWLATLGLIFASLVMGAIVFLIVLAGRQRLKNMEI